MPEEELPPVEGWGRIRFGRKEASATVSGHAPTMRIPQVQRDVVVPRKKKVVIWEHASHIVVIASPHNRIFFLQTLRHCNKSSLEQTLVEQTLADRADTAPDPAPHRHCRLSGNLYLQWACTLLFTPAEWKRHPLAISSLVHHIAGTTQVATMHIADFVHRYCFPLITCRVIAVMALPVLQQRHRTFLTYHLSPFAVILPFVTVVFLYRPTRHSPRVTTQLIN